MSIDTTGSPEDLPILNWQKVDEWYARMKQWENIDVNPKRAIHTEDLIAKVERRDVPDEERITEKDDTYVDRRVSRAPLLYVETQAEKHQLRLEIHTPLDAPGKIDYYSMEFDYFQMEGPKAAHYLKINAVDRELVAEIHDAIAAKLQETQSGEATEHWLIHESPYSSQRSPLNPASPLVEKMEGYLAEIDQPIES